MVTNPEDRDGIVITISSAMLKERGYRNWLRNFLGAMASDNKCYFLRAGNRPKAEPLHVYLCIGGRIRFRCRFVDSLGPNYITFDTGKTMFANAWVVMAGPVERPPAEIKMKGFQGFRYTKTLW